MEQLPEKWCIKVDGENCNMLSEYRNAGGPIDDGWLWTDESEKWKGTWVSERPYGYVVISTSDFRRLILKEKEPLYEIY